MFEKPTTFLLILSVIAWIMIFYCNNASAEVYSIPSWLKNNAGWWHDEKIDDSDFVQGMQYLINQGIIKIPQTTSGTHLSQQLPLWVKTVAGAWSDNQLSDE